MDLIRKNIKHFDDLIDRFSASFPDSKKRYHSHAPASIMLLGDHTHYNDGILLSNAVDKFTTVILSPRIDGEKTVLLDNQIFELSIKAHNAFRKNWILEYIIVLLENLEERYNRKFGFNALVDVDIPVCLGIGRYASLGSAFLRAFNSAFDIYMTTKDIVNFTQGTEKDIIEQISNRGHHFTSNLNPAKSLVITDLRKDEPSFIPFPSTKYAIVLTDTKIDIKNPSQICNERIEECQVGVKGLRLYIWGIKNLRDIKKDFLERHIHMIPRLVYKRCYYNVTERERLERAIEAIEKRKFTDFGNTICESHQSLKTDYDLSTEMLDFISQRACEYNGVLGSKMISCSPRRSVFNLVQKHYVDEFIELIQRDYSEKNNAELETHKLNLIEGAEYLN